jgi:lipid-binding SYLF domain-containing protein/predicted outer membrane protein
VKVPNKEKQGSRRLLPLTCCLNAERRDIMHQFNSIIIACALAAFASGTQAQTPGTVQSPGMASGAAGSAMNRGNVPQDGSDFLKMASQAGHGELQAAQLALDRARDPDVKEYARRMIQDHTQANAELQRVAQQKNIILPTELAVLDRSRMRLLAAADAQNFDRTYLDDFGVAAHRRTIELFRLQAQNGRDPDVMAYARQTLPTLERHLQMAQNMQASLMRDGAGANTAASRTATLPSSSAIRTDANAQTAKVDHTEESRKARAELDEAIQVVQRMKADPGITSLLERARGVFILPDYGRAALGLGVQGGQGVLVTRQGDNFSNPVFYNMGGFSVGAQAGASGGQIALLLMSDKAVQAFKSNRSFSLNADASVTVADYSERAHASRGKVQDVIVWSGTKGAYAGASLGLSDVVFDADTNRAYYGRDDVDVNSILEGRVQNPGNNVLGIVLAV